MSDEKPIHVPREKYPELTYPAAVAMPAPITAVEDESDEIHLLDYWRVLMSRRWTVFAVFATVVGVTLIATFKQPQIYQASTTVQIDRENPNILSFKDVYEVESATDDTLQTQYRVLESRSLARRVIEELHLDRVDELKQEDGFLDKYFPSVADFFSGKSHSTTEPDNLRPIIDNYLERLEVSPVRQARLVRVSFQSKDPKLAADIINAHAKFYKEQNLQFKWNATQEASTFLQEQLGTLRASLEKAEDKLQAYSREKQILFTDEGKNTATEKLQRLEQEYTKAQTERFQKESYDSLVQLGHGETLPQLMNNQLVATLITKLTDLQKEDSELAVTFAPDYPRRKRVRSQIEEIQASIKSENDRLVQAVEAEYSAAVEREQLTRGALDEQKNVVNILNQEIVQYGILRREADSYKQLYDGLQTRLREAQVSAGLRASNIRVVDQAEIPEVPVKPRKFLNLSLGAMIGLILGVGLAFFQEYLDNSVKSPEDVQRFLGVPTLATIPNVDSLSKGQSYRERFGAYSTRKALTKEGTEKAPLELITYAMPASLMSESYRSLRTSLLLSAPDTAPRVVLITSAVPSEGKTVTAINTAISLTQTGSRVVLIDADMRKPRIHSVFSLGELHGLSSFLTGSAVLKDVIHSVNIPNLFLIPCGVIPPNPGELILSTRFIQLLKVLRQYFDYVVVDSPPLTNVSDARILATNTDATLVVVKAFSTSRHLAKRAVEHLQQARARNIAVVLNDLDVHVKSSYYSYYSGRYYYPSNYQGRPSA